MIEATLLVLLGFLTASLLALIIAPAFWGRAVRLTTTRIRNSLPMTEAEIRAEKDQMRAKYAVRVHQLEKAIDDARLKAARQQIELNRRDAQLQELDGRREKLQDDLQENKNARRVLDETINKRLPVLEQRLFEAGQMLNTRDRDLTTLRQAHADVEMALEEAKTINLQQNEELEYLRKTLNVRQETDRQRLTQFGVDSDGALYNEVMLLRERNREQARVIETLRQQATTALDAVTGRGAQSDGLAQPGHDAAALSQRSGLAQLDALREFAQDQAARIEDLTQQLQSALASGQTASENNDGLMKQMRAIQAKAAGLQDELERVKAERDALHGVVKQQGDGASAGKLRGSSHLLAKIDGLERQLEHERALSQRLRLELTATHERTANQAQAFRDQVRHQSSGTASRRAKGPGGPARRVDRASAYARLQDDLVRLKRRSAALGADGAGIAPGAAVNDGAPVARTGHRTVMQNVGATGTRGGDGSAAELASMDAGGGAAVRGGSLASALHGMAQTPGDGGRMVEADVEAGRGLAAAPSAVTVNQGASQASTDGAPVPAPVDTVRADEGGAHTGTATSTPTAVNEGASSNAGSTAGGRTKLLERLRSYN